MDREIKEKIKPEQSFDGHQENFVIYVCGGIISQFWRSSKSKKGCGKEVFFEPTNDDVICKECGYRILYKKRTRAVMQYEAR